MSKPFDYSKWDNIEISDDDEDCHPNIDRESWFRMKHRSRVEREENEEKDKKAIKAEMEKANQRIKILKHDIAKVKQQQQQKSKVDDDDDDDDDDDLDLDDCEGMEAELNQLQQQQAQRQAKLDEYEKNKKWNIDNMFHVKEERTVVNPTAGQTGYTPTGYVKDTDATTTTTTTTTTETTKDAKKKAAASPAPKKTTTPAGPKPPPSSASSTASTTSSTTSSKKTAPTTTTLSKTTKTTSPEPAPVQVGAMETYHEFTQKNANLVEQFMALKTMEESKEFLLKHGNILLQENASNYLLLASLEDEMNGHREKMKLVARQSQIVTNIAEMAKTLQQHPGNVIQPFFARMQQREPFAEFMNGVNAFVDKIIKRAVVKKHEMDQARQAQQQHEQAAAAEEEAAAAATRSLEDIPREERLGPGGLDPLEVIETLPKEMVEAFESRDVEQLREALMKLNPDDAQYHMKRCIDSGLWVANNNSDIAEEEEEEEE